jgi:pimeloyl-ACP methyl ester carboxylesterase
MARQIVAILIHGIRTEAWWQDRVASILSRDTGATVIPLKYGYFDLLRFWCPLGICRNGPIERLRKQIEGVRQSYKDCRLVVFAHSFGTSALAQILLDNPYFTFDRIVLCGSIVRENFDWRRVENQIISDEKRNAIINDCGTRDVWPVLAKSASWDYGASGTLGFGSFNVKDRFHPFRHSDFFATIFVRDYWVPAVIGKPIEDARVDAKDVGTPAWFGLLRFPLRWIIAVGIPLLAVLAALPPLLQLLDPVQIMNTPSGVSLIDPTQDTKDVAEFEFEPLPGSSIQFRLKGTYSVGNRTVSGVMTDGYFQTTEQFVPCFKQL